MSKTRTSLVVIAATSGLILAIGTLYSQRTAPGSATPRAVLHPASADQEGQAAPAQSESQPSDAPARPMVLSRSVSRMTAERLAKKIIDASPMVDPLDAEARDLAAERLANCKELLDAAGGKILWGGYHPKQGFHPKAYRLTEDSPLDFFQLTEFIPMVWAKLYLSTFMFSGEYEIKEVDGLTVLTLGAKFRGGLDPGEYPYPFWHSPNKWTAYMNSDRVHLIFDSGVLVASLRQSSPPEALRLIRRRWDAQWTWSDETGSEQPRVTLFTYLFSSDNPHVTALDKSYRTLEQAFREQNCMSCHAPDNRGRINDLLLLNYPNQSLIMRRTLVTVLEANEMPPGDLIAGEPGGIKDRQTLDYLISLAKDFEAKADAAMAFEQSRKSER